MAKHPLRVLVTGAELVSSAVDKLASIGASLTMMPGKLSEQRLIEELAKQPVQAILMRGNPPVSEAVLDAAPELRVIAKHGAGVDSVDLAAATARKVLVMVAGDANAPAVAELTLGCILALGRELMSLSARVKAGQWDRGSYHGRELRGRTLGLIGFGRIGRRVAELAQRRRLPGTPGARQSQSIRRSRKGRQAWRRCSLPVTSSACIARLRPKREE